MLNLSKRCQAADIQGMSKELEHADTEQHQACQRSWSKESTEQQQQQEEYAGEGVEMPEKEPLLYKISSALEELFAEEAREMGI